MGIRTIEHLIVCHRHIKEVRLGHQRGDHSEKDEPKLVIREAVVDVEPLCDGRFRQLDHSLGEQHRLQRGVKRGGGVI